MTDRLGELHLVVGDHIQHRVDFTGVRGAGHEELGHTQHKARPSNGKPNQAVSVPLRLCGSSPSWSLDQK